MKKLHKKNAVLQYVKYAYSSIKAALQNTVYRRVGSLCETIRSLG